MKSHRVLNDLTWVPRIFFKTFALRFFISLFLGLFASLVVPKMATQQAHANEQQAEQPTEQQTELSVIEGQSNDPDQSSDGLVWTSHNTAILSGSVHKKNSLSLIAPAGKGQPRQKATVALQNRSRIAASSALNLFLDAALEASLDSHQHRTWRLGLAEAYAAHDVGENLNLGVGKKLIRWGTGVLVNPIDVFSQSKNPIDQRQRNRHGAWSAQAEYTTEQLTVSLVGSLAVSESAHGVPDKVTSKEHALGARVFSSVSDFDVTLAAFYTNRYKNAFEQKPAVGFAVSRLVTAATEAHVEGLVRKGSARTFVIRDCVATQAQAVACVRAHKEFLAASKLTSQVINLHVIAGTRTQFQDDSFLTFEVLFFSDGDTTAEYADRLKLLERLAELNQPAVASRNADGDKSAESDDLGVELQRKVYFSAGLQRWKAQEDVFASLPVFVNVSDGSGVVSPEVNWTPRQSLSFTASSAFFFALAKYSSDGVKTKHGAEFLQTPNSASFSLEAKAFF